jgi:hypothetical protein
MKAHPENVEYRTPTDAFVAPRCCANTAMTGITSVIPNISTYNEMREFH